MIAEPIVEGACNYEALLVLQESPEEYARLAEQYILASQKKAADAAAAMVAAVNLSTTQPMPAKLKKAAVVYGRDPSKGNTFIPFPQKAEAPKRKPNVSFDDYYRQWSQVATTRKGGVKLQRPNTEKFNANRSTAVAEIETNRRDLIYGEAMGGSHGFGQNVWYTEEHHRIAATLPMPEKVVSNFVVLTTSAIPGIPSGQLGGGGGGGGGEATDGMIDDDDLDAEADDLLNFVGGLDGDS